MQKTMLIYIDTEFTDFIDTKLISAGLVGEDGKECYVELTDTYTMDDCSNFVLDAVIPELDHKTYGVESSEACQRIIDFVEAYGPGVECQLACDYPYDFDLIVDLFSECNKPWPENLSLKPKMVNYSLVELCVENFFATRRDMIRHHALHDARALAFASKPASEKVKLLNQYRLRMESKDD